MASVGSYSGALGTIILPFLQGAQLWVQDINRRGGLNGHRVNLLTYDDGGDPARHRAQVQEAVEQRGAIAFLMNGEVVTGASSVAYLEAKRIPVIGVTGGEAWATPSPMYFPQTSTGDAWGKANFWGMAGQAVAKGKKKMASVVCVEAPACNEWSALVGKANEFGLENVYRGRASITQPDYTAECLSARNASADLFFVVLDQNSIGRVASSCARQGYRPVYAAGGPSVTDQLKGDPNLEGFVAGSVVAPYFQTNTPATAEYQQAFRTFAKGKADVGVANANGWVAGKLLERAGSHLPEPPTTAALLTGLWSIKADNLGGWTYPLTFAENQPAQQQICWFNLTISDGLWSSPDNFNFKCR